MDDMTTHSNYLALFEQINAGTLVITPNARLALRLNENYKRLQTKTVWETPKIYPINAWLTSLWQQLSQLLLLKPLLNPFKEARLWQQVVSDLSPQAVAKERLAEELQSSWALAHAWQLNLSHAIFSYNDETAFFYQALSAFKNKVTHYQPTSTLANELIEIIKAQKPLLPKNLIMAFFDDVTPCMQELLNTLTEQGVTISHFSGLESLSNNAVVCAFETQKEQLSALVPWLQQLREQQIDNIAIVVPDLNERRDDIESYLTQYFPRSELNFSQGYPLTHYGIVATAIHLLKLKSKWLLTIKDCYFLLLNPFLKTSHYQKDGDAIIQTLKKKGESHTTQPAFLKLIQNDELKQCLSTFYKKNTGGHLTLHHWKQCFQTLLNITDYANNSLSSKEYQTLNKFYETLESFVDLQSLDETLSYEQALHLFEWLCTKTTFQPESNNEPIQILGLIEALGQSFNATWVLDMTADTLPQKTNPSPFIPLYLQRQHQMPKACERRELTYAKKIIERLQSASPKVIFSYYRSHQDEAVLLSPLLADIPKEDYPTRQTATSFDAEYYKPCYQVKKAATDDIKGGSFLLKEQAICPFRAFAQFRLKLREEKKIQQGLDELDRGTLIHLALELFWRDVGSQQELLSFDDDALEALASSAATRAVATLKKERPLTMSDDFCHRETARITKLMLKFLHLEKARPPFVVSSLEEKQQYQIAGVNLSLRVDRIDTLESGKKAVIDYKTGSPSVESWFGDTIEEPQLPLYSLGDNDISTLMYVILKHHEIKYKGVDTLEHDIEGLRPLSRYSNESFDELKETWLAQLTETMQQFIDGNIAATPHKESRCNTCHVKSLCGKLYS